MLIFAFVVHHSSRHGSFFSLVFTFSIIHISTLETSHEPLLGRLSFFVTTSIIIVFYSHSLIPSCETSTRSLFTKTGFSKTGSGSHAEQYEALSLIEKQFELRQILSYLDCRNQKKRSRDQALESPHTAFATSLQSLSLAYWSSSVTSFPSVHDLGRSRQGLESDQVGAVHGKGKRENE